MKSSPILLAKSEFFTRWLPLLAFCAVLANHFWYVNSHAINIPHQDDIYDFIEFVSLVENADNTSDAFSILFSQYNDHRTSATRALVLGIYLIEGELDFHTLTLAANLGLWLILLLFYLTVRKEKYRWVYLLISALLLLNLRTYEIVIFSQAAFAFYYVCFYAFACIFLLHRVTLPRFLLAAVFCTLSSLTLASGQIVWLLGLASLVHQCLFAGRRSLIWPAMWLLVAAVVLMLWHADFTPVTHKLTSELIMKSSDAPPVVLGGGFQTALVDPSIVQTLVRYAVFFFALLGSAPFYFSAVAAGVAGFVLLAVLSFFTLKFYQHDDIRLALYCWFIVGFAAAVTVGRSLLAGPDYILTSRYSFISLLLVCTLVLLLLVRSALGRRPLVVIILALAVVYFGWLNSHFETTAKNYTNGRFTTYNRGHFPVMLMPVGESGLIVKKAISAGIYNPPCRPFPRCDGDQPPSDD